MQMHLGESEPQMHEHRMGCAWCVRSLIILCSVVPDGYRVRLIRVAQFVATLYFVQQIDKAAGDWSDADRRIDSGALRDGALAKIDGLWQIAMQLHSKGLP